MSASSSRELCLPVLCWRVVLVCCVKGCRSAVSCALCAVCCLRCRQPNTNRRALLELSTAEPTTVPGLRREQLPHTHDTLIDMIRVATTSEGIDEAVRIANGAAAKGFVSGPNRAVLGSYGGSPFDRGRSLTARSQTAQEVAVVLEIKRWSTLSICPHAISLVAQCSPRSQTAQEVAVVLQQISQDTMETITGDKTAVSAQGPHFER